MKYQYNSPDPAAIPEISTKIREKFPDRVEGHVLDIEGVIEDLGITILPRPLGKLLVEGYAARDPHLIVVNKDIFIGSNRARFTLAEELAHKVLEFDLWNSGNLPAGAKSEEMDPDQLAALERDAKRLAAEILQPEAIYRERYSHHWSILESEGKTDFNWCVRTTVELVAGEFHVGFLTAAVRARELEIISYEEYHRCFPPVM